ncbi:hypothetical protein [Comamonas thiooxydans]|uniref:hypothetical protein n=1 Tax=Comamonas thiooxydans TaxID=363952 RepID=UPI000B41A3BD|nr:hypothetical protein [Comamonas thiooxydans]
MHAERVDVHHNLEYHQPPGTSEFVLSDHEGRELGNLPCSFTPDQIRAAAELANQWYLAGIEAGRKAQLEELGIQRNT